MGNKPSTPKPPPSTDIKLNLIYYVNAICLDTFSQIQDPYQENYSFQYKFQPYTGTTANSVILSSIESKIPNISIYISTKTDETRSRLFNAQYGGNNSLNNIMTQLKKELANGGRGAHIRPSSNEPYEDYLKRFYTNEYHSYDRNLCFQYKHLDTTDNRWSNGIKIKLIEYEDNSKKKIKAEHYYFISISDIEKNSSNKSFSFPLKKILT